MLEACDPNAPLTIMVLTRLRNMVPGLPGPGITPEPCVRAEPNLFLYSYNYSSLRNNDFLMSFGVQLLVIYPFLLYKLEFESYQLGYIVGWKRWCGGGAKVPQYLPSSF